MSRDELNAAKQALGVQTDRELAEILGVSIPSINNYRIRGIPQKLRALIAEKKLENQRGEANMDTEDFRALSEEMKQFYGVSSLEDVAEKMGYSKKNATNWRKNRKLSAHAQLKWLEAKKGQTQTTFVAVDSDTKRDMLSIPLLSAKASAGHGIENFEVEAIGEFSISPMLFRTHQSPQHLRLIEVVGDSMSPTLKDGDFVLIDTSKTGGAQDGIYVLILGSDLLVSISTKSPSLSVGLIESPTTSISRRCCGD